MVSRIFEENQQYTRHLAEQNKRLDKLVARRTERLKETTERREREYACCALCWTPFRKPLSSKIKKASTSLQ